MTTIPANLQAVRDRIEAACAAAGRDPGGVRLLAVSKTWPVDAVRAAAACGQRAFGESYVQEALPKIAALRGLELEWHFVGPLQSNKTRAVAEAFAWVHSIDRAKIAERLAAQRPAHLPPLQVCIEVNLGNEASKSGCTPDQAAGLARLVAGLPQLSLRGFMAIPEASDLGARRARFAELRRLCGRVAGECGLNLDTLSMGMSDDLEAAIAEGATIVRIGTAVFGRRQSRAGSGES